MFPRPRILLCGGVWWLASLSVWGQATHYAVKLTPDFEHQILHGEERIEFSSDARVTEWQKKEGVRIAEVKVTGGEATVSDTGVSIRIAASGRHVLNFKYEAAGGQGLRWFVGPPTNQEYSGKTGFFTAFYCDAWMVCDTSPAQRATLTLEIIIPFQHGGEIGLRAVGPGERGKEIRGRDGDHFFFELSRPVQTYLFSFGVARLAMAVEGNFLIYAPDLRSQNAAFAKTADAYAFMRGKASVDLPDSGYTQAFLPVGHAGFGQEVAGMAMMSEEYFPELTEKDDVQLMAHELAHQWWGVLVGIHSWSDFWLSEGFAEFMADAYIEKHRGRAAYEKQITELHERMQKLREDGKDRSLHWDEWKDAREALGAIPYVKGALFLDRLRRELGEDKFWQGIGLYTSRNARRLVDSRDFERAMVEASGRDLHDLFEESVYR